MSTPCRGRSTVDNRVDKVAVALDHLGSSGTATSAATAGPAQIAEVAAQHCLAATPETALSGPRRHAYAATATARVGALCVPIRRVAHGCTGLPTDMPRCQGMPIGETDPARCPWMYAGADRCNRRTTCRGMSVAAYRSGAIPGMSVAACDARAVARAALHVAPVQRASLHATGAVACNDAEA
jgi:hypothetical protein